MIKVYTTPTCPWCQKVKAYLKSKDVEYTEVNVMDDLEGRKEMIDLSEQQGVPVINIDGKIIVGFNKEAIDAEIQK